MLTYWISQEDTYLLDKAALKDWLLSDLPTPKEKLKVGSKNGTVEEKEEDVIIVAPDTEMQDAEMSEGVPSREDSITPTVKSDDLNTVESEQDTDKSQALAQPKIISNDSIICPHGLANPLNATNMKRISQVYMVVLFTGCS